MDAMTDRRAEPFTLPYLLRLFTQAPNAQWRFDVDVSLAAAARMARFAQLGPVRGVMYVMAVSDYYNACSPENAHHLREIYLAGHRLALHCDYRMEDASDGEVIREVRRQQGILDAAYPGLFSRDLVSFHMPGPSLLWTSFEAFQSAYAAEWEGRYVSDARKRWGPEQEAGVTNDAQVCLHAEHWFS